MAASVLKWVFRGCCGWVLNLAAGVGGLEGISSRFEGSHKARKPPRKRCLRMATRKMTHQSILVGYDKPPTSPSTPHFHSVGGGRRDWGGKGVGGGWESGEEWERGGRGVRDGRGVGEW